jgi:hypothetical protein
MKEKAHALHQSASSALLSESSLKPGHMPNADCHVKQIGVRGLRGC